MRYLFICLLLLLTTYQCQAKIITTQTPYHKPIHRGFHNYNRYQNPQYNHIHGHNLNALEKYALKKSFPRENEITRLERLESLAFGSIQQGDINTRYKNVEKAILSRPQNNYQNSFLNNVANYFSGHMTGYTPGLTPNYNYYNPHYGSDYGISRYDSYSNGLFNNGYGLFNSSSGTGSSIHILD